MPTPLSIIWNTAFSSDGRTAKIRSAAGAAVERLEAEGTEIDLGFSNSFDSLFWHLSVGVQVDLIVTNLPPAFARRPWPGKGLSMRPPKEEMPRPYVESLDDLRRIRSAAGDVPILVVTGAHPSDVPDDDVKAAGATWILHSIDLGPGSWDRLTESLANWFERFLRESILP